MRPAAAALQELLRVHGIPGAVEVRRCGRGTVGHVFRLDGPAGPHYLKLGTPARRRHGELGHVLSRRCAAAGLPAVVARELPDGTALSVTGDVTMALYPAAPGHHRRRYHWSVATARAAGRLLARVHEALRPLPRPDLVVLDQPNVPALVSARLERVLPLATDPRARADIRARLRQLDTMDPLPPFDAGDCQLVHGDVQDSNLLFGDDGEITGLVDWDQPSWRSRRIDLMRMLDFSYLVDVPAWRAAALGGYSAVVPLDDTALEEAAQWWHRRRLLDVWLLEEAYLRHNHRVLRLLPAQPRSFGERWRASSRMRPLSQSARSAHT